MAIFSTAIGLVYALLLPPFQSPDESSHFLRAWQISEGGFFPERTDQRLGGELPSSVPALCDSFLYIRLNSSARADAAQLKRLLGTPLRPNERHFTDFANTAIYSPAAYLPQALAIALLRPLGATPLQILYGIRMVDLLLWVVLLMAALSRFPFLNGSMAAFGVLPATLVLAASASPDMWTNGLCWWMSAVFLNSAAPFGKKAFAATLAVLHKVIVLPVVLPGLLWGLNKRRALFAGLALSMVAILWSAFANRLFIPYDAYNPAFRDAQTLNSGVNPASQLVFVLQHPLYFIKVAISSAWHSAPSVAAHLVGKFGWEKNYLPGYWLTALWLCMAALLFSEENPLRARTRTLLAGIVLLYVAAFALTMYALWCAVGAPEVHNWQGRYFIAILPAAALTLGNGWLKKYRKWIEWGNMVVLLAANGAMIYAVYLRYW